MGGIQEIAYEMEKAYKTNKTQGEAVEDVKKAYPEADVNLLWAMWSAIDAYIDINT